MTDLEQLAQRVEALGEHGSNELDVLVEVALFIPNEHVTGIRKNDAGTKVIYHYAHGEETTSWAWDWTTKRNRERTIQRLRARKDRQ